MDITGTSGKRVNAGQGELVTAGGNQTTVRKSWKTLAAVVLGLLLSVPELSQAQYVLVNLTIDAPGATRTSANGISANGIIVGDFDDADGNTHGFVWKNGVFTTFDVDVPNAGVTALTGVNAPGWFSGFYVDPNGTSWGFFLRDGNLKTLKPDGAIRSQASFLNAQGQVVGTYRTADQARHGFIWNGGDNYTTFNVTGNELPLGTVAFGINDVGQVVGNYVYVDSTTNTLVRAAFLRSRKGDYTTFVAPGAAPDPDHGTGGEGINNGGTIVGIYFAADDIAHGFVWKNGVLTQVDVPNALETQIFSINAQGQIVGTYTDNKGTHGFRGTLVL